MSDNRPIAYVEQQVVVIRASALGECTRNLWGALAGIDAAERPDWLDQAAREGNLHEEAVATDLEKSGTKFLGRQQLVEYWVIPGTLMIRGHTDGSILPGSQPEGIEHPLEKKAIWECKSMSRAVWDLFVGPDGPRWEAKTNYAWQLSVYMAGTGVQDAVYTCKRRDDGETRHFLITEPPHTETEIRAKALKVFAAYKLDEMPACDPVRFPCERFFLHDEEDIPEEDLYTGPSDIVDRLAADYTAAKEKADHWDKEKRRLRAVLINTVGKGATAITDSHKVQVIHKHRQSIARKTFVDEYGQEAWDKMQNLCSCGKLGNDYEEVRVNAST